MGTLHTLQAVMKDLWQFVLAGFSYAKSVSQERDEFMAPLELVPQRYYDSNHSQTNHLRLRLTGQYSDVEVVRPLQPSEYVCFMLQKIGVQLNDDMKKWLPGYWHQKLKGNDKVHISVTPMQNSVIEYFDEQQDGVVGFVTDVHDDESLTFGSVGMYQSGVYEEHTVPRHVWHELRPVFISFMK